MATSKDFSEWTLSSSEEVFDFTCTLCAENNIKKESDFFCVECVQYLCSECLKYHNRWPVMTRHVMLGKEKFSSISKLSNLPIIPTDRCSVHTTKVIEMYCGTHDQVACTVCFILDHKSCKDMHYIPDVVHQLDTQQTRLDTKAALIKASDEMKHLETALKVSINEMNVAKEETLSEINKFRTKLNKILDELEKNTKQDVEKQCQLFDTQIQNNIEKVSSIIQDLQKRADRLECSGRGDSQQFVLTKTSMTTISTAENISKQLYPSSIQFTVSKNLALESCLEHLKSLAEISTFILRAPDLITKQGIYKVKETHHLSVHTDGDDFMCSIWGSCVLASGALLLADFANHKLKLFDTNANAVRNHCEMPARPIAVCTISDDEAIVTLLNKTIHFVSIFGEKVLPAKQLQMNHECYGLAFAGGQIYITDKCRNLYVHDMNGQLLRTIDIDQAGNEISVALHVAVCNNKIYVADNNNGLITLDTNGQMLWKFSDLDTAYGVCTDVCGNVFVSDLDSNTVLQIGQDGKRLGEIVNESHGISCPRSVCFDSKRSTLIVSQELNDDLLLFTLQ